MPITLPELPFALDALEPHISSETLKLHHDKHHRAYVEKANELLAGTPFENRSQEDIIREASGGLFNQVAQAWNHSFFWHCLSPAPGDPDARLMQAIRAEFGGLEAFRKLFTDSAAELFGSGWTWLVRTTRGKLRVINADNADNPLRTGDTPLLCCDVWEHAYYLDYQNRRPEYLEHFWPLINWNFVNKAHSGQSATTSRKHGRTGSAAA
jgi:superoxide dismutase, Fe-Mn family